ncbi:cytochrome P450 family monooxygenase (macronuclear) [Tetrahymena thermophila SB210]|uniref:Cytochrome P450 family monooxygenase n=1 Tax=Tetrahymena thermophila (strain SB210) TaxID=312017 RepID=Q23BY0_TETTS|nr:cytochrome P450 family monooxygenase [Tetrahymena thermophila SB210]EAR93988.2 cytochrome P450 family monooxygenase [Tetrahymena thermophila SB210]|eukprot:XP_001014233.2 cytochrome P450 family monooxygenase [Tetrahymena thermophila SB210]
MKNETSFTCLNVYKVIMQRKEELQKDSSLFKRNLLDLYLKEIPLNENKEITIDEIITNFCALFFAGTDKIGNMTGVSLYCLSQNPEIQEEARDEMPLVHSILKESLRLIPPAAAVLGRYANKDIEIGEFYVKKGYLFNTKLSKAKEIQTYTKILKNLTYIDG